MILRKAIGWFGVAIIACIILAIIIAYFIFSFNPKTGIMCDGFGRQLYDAPWFIRIVLGNERRWVGWAWFIGDIFIVGWGFGIGSFLAKWGFGKK